MTLQFDTMELYRRNGEVDGDYSLTSIVERDLTIAKTMLQPHKEGKVKYDQTTDTYHVDCGHFKSPNRLGMVYSEEALRDAYAVYNLQAMRLEEVISAQRRLDEVIAKKRKKDPNYNVTVLRRDGSMP